MSPRAVKYYKRVLVAIGIAQQDRLRRDFYKSDFGKEIFLIEGGWDHGEASYSMAFGLRLFSLNPDNDTRLRQSHSGGQTGRHPFSPVDLSVHAPDRSGSGAF